LLTEAGYADGFEFTLDCPNNRYVNDEEICEALVGMWERIGVKVRLNAMPFSNLIPRLEKFDSSAYLLGWGATTYDALSSLQSLVRTRANGADGSYNMGRISDPKIDALIDGAKSETDLSKRDEMLREALQLTARNYYYLPIHHQMRPWVMKKSVTTVHKSDDRPESRFAVVKP
jgi:peptide/nickel transport system substrate-binding protein